MATGTVQRIEKARAAAVMPLRGMRVDLMRCKLRFFLLIDPGKKGRKHLYDLHGSIEVGRCIACGRSDDVFVRCIEARYHINDAN